MRNTLKAVKKSVDDADKARKANMMQNVRHYIRIVRGEGWGAEWTSFEFPVADDCGFIL